MNREMAGRYQLAEAASHFLYTAFEHAATTLRLECAGIIFEQEIMKIDVPDDWDDPSHTDGESNPLDTDKEVLPAETLDQMSAAWKEAQRRAGTGEVAIPKNHTITRVEVASHVTNLHSVVETVANRHLHVLKEKEKLKGAVYKSLDRASLLSKISYAFKHKISSGELQIGRFRQLNSLRNAAVHYRSDSRDRLTPSVIELVNIWREVGDLLELVGGEPKKEKLEDLAGSVLNRYVD